MAWFLGLLALFTMALVALSIARHRRRTVTDDSPSRPSAASQADRLTPWPPRGSSRPEGLPMKSCPVCLSEYPTRDRYCVRDGAQLIEGSSSGPFTQGVICPTCRRGYPFDARFCPEDADELVPYGLYGAASATRPPLRLDANKICPECGIRHVAAHLFCGEDGTQLVVVN
jgi:hypothetical protein